MPLLIAVVLLVALPATAAGAEVGVVDLERPSPVSEYAGVTVVSAYDQSTSAYYLSVVRDGRLERLSAAPSPVAFDADVGPDPSGRPAVVFTRCDDPVQRIGCDVYLVSLNGPQAGRERPLSGVNTAASEFSPTLWHGRVAFARRSGRRSPIVYTRLLDQPRSAPSRRQLSALPTRRCEVQFEAGDCTTRSRIVQDLELRGGMLAMEVGYTVEHQVGFATTEIRLGQVSRRTVRKVALLTSGEGGQGLVGLSFAGGWLGWYKTCFGDPSGCNQSGGAFRFAPAKGRYEYVKDSRQFEGFALLQDGSLRVSGDERRGCESEQEYRPGTGPCPLVRTRPLRFRPIDARRVGGRDAR